VWIAAAPSLAVPALARSNYRGRTVITAAGVVLPLTVVLVEAGRAVARSFGVEGSAGITLPRVLVLLAVAGFGLLGVVDDIGGSAEHRGFRGHLGALWRGRPTTGLVKLVGGAAVALVIVSPLAGDAPGPLLADAALIALCANLANLLDRRPGRTVKVGIAGFVVMALATGGDPALLGVAVVVGAGLGLLLDDLHEHIMLGDAGANALGAALGLGLVLVAAPATRTMALVVVAGLNLVGEVVSFSRVIDAVPPLRALDRAGRRP
jgi:UDP-N-acetylmuramyl pentapeptide phosphotransferase/UDP-N-acetylglucosamine-1-phosphate transferase